MSSMTGTSVSRGQKQERRRTPAGAAMTGAGTVAAGTGLLAGGIPGVKEPAPEKMFGQLKGTTTKEMFSRKNLRHNIREGRTFPRAGILGFRAAAHDNVTSSFKQALPTKGKGKVDDYGNQSTNYLRGHLKGKIQEEERVLSGLRRARKASYGLTLGGGALAIAGSRKKVEKSDRRSQNYSAGALGTGAALAAVGHGVPKALDRQGKKFERKAIAHTERAAALAPHYGGVKEVPGKKGPWFDTNGQWIRKPKKMMEPVRSDRELRGAGGANDIQGGPNSARADQVGRLRGRAGQEKHFAEVFQSTSRAFRRARTPGLLLAAGGGGGLAATRDRQVAKFDASAITRHSKHGVLYTGAMLGAGQVAARQKGDPNEGIGVTGGALAGQAAYQAAGKEATRRNDKYSRTKGRKKLAAAGFSGTKQDKRADRHFAEHGIPGARTKHVHDAHERYREAFRNYPPELPGAKVKRILARTHAGRSGDIVGTAATVAGGLIGGKLITQPKDRVRKSAGEVMVGKSRTYGYQEKKRSYPRTAELVVGGSLMAWGGSRLKMLGPLTNHGARLAAKHGGQREADQALKIAREIGRSTRDFTGRGEAQLRRIKQLNTAIEAVPANLRPAVATSAGALLAGRAVPTHDERFVPTGSFR